MKKRSIVAIAVIAATLVFTPLSANATQPGTNGPLAFAGDTGAGVEIFAVQPDGTGLRQLTQLGGTASTPEYSPDGSHLVFSVEDEGIYLMNADGTGQHQVTGPEGAASWTPDGQHLVYECGDCAGGDGIFLIRADGSNAPGVRLSKNPYLEQGDSNPEVSPDGQTVTFVRHQVDGELQALFAVNIAGTNERALTNYDLEVGIKHDWSPDGTHIVLTTYADFPGHRSPNVATIRSDGSDLQMLTHFNGGGSAALAGSYSPDGQWIAYRQQNKAHSGLWQMHPDGSHRHQIASFAFRPRFIDWGSQR